MSEKLDFDALNIFFVHINPTLAAIALPDAHIRKMVVESTQLLANAYHLERAVRPPPVTSEGKPYRPAFLNHPAAKWAVEDFKQWDWLRMHAISLANEFEYRWAQPHATLAALRYMTENLPLAWMTNREFYAPPMLMPDEYKSRIAGHIKSYREYIRRGKRHLHTWTRRLPPLWLVDLREASVVVDKLVEDCTLDIANQDAIRPPGLNDKEWKLILMQAIAELNGLGVDDPDERMEEIIEAADVSLVKPEKYRPTGLNPAEWSVILHIAREKVNGRDPLADPTDWDYTRGNY